MLVSWSSEIMLLSVVIAWYMGIVCHLQNFGTPKFTAMSPNFLQFSINV